jgi:vacuolar protein sorting-associated protein 45
MSINKKNKNHQNIDSIEDIKKFVENYPEFKKLSGNVTKHVTLLGELSKLVDQRSLMDLSEIEQELANNHDHSLHVKMVKDALKDNRFTKEDKVRLVLLYTIRYETYSNEIPAMIELLQQIGCSSEQYSLVSSIIKYAGANVRTGELFIKNSLKRTLKILQRGLKGVSNIYTEHKPYLKQILESLLIQKLPLDMYPFYIGSPTKESPQEIIVFFVGGTTYEEALTVHELKQTNKNISGVRIILGGTTIHNSKSFLHDITQINSFK